MCLLFFFSQAETRFETGLARVAIRKSRALLSLALSPPRSDEISLIHSLHLESMNLKEQKDMIMQNQLSKLVASISDKKHNEESDKSLHCAAEGTPVNFHALETPHLFSAKFKWMKNTIFKNVEIMFPQVPTVCFAYI